MRKFIYSTIKGTGSIYECEVSIVSPRPYQCKGDEQLYLVHLPEKFKDEKWYSQFFCDTLEECKAKAESIVRVEAQFRLAKKKINTTEEEIQKRISEIGIELLS